MQDEKHDDLDLGGGGETAGPDDPLAGVEPEPIEDVSEAGEEERLGGDGAALGDPPASEVLEEPEETEVEETEEPAGEAAEEEQAAAPKAEEPEPEPAAEPTKPKGKRKAPKTKPRKYVILRIYGDDSIQKPLEGGPVEARNGDDAIKVAYKQLAESAEDEMELVAVPEGYWKPKKVKGRKKEDYAVEVG